MRTAGYSGTTLAKKLGIKENSTVKLMNEPETYFEIFSDFPVSVQIVKDSNPKKDLIHYFTKSASRLQIDFRQMRNEIRENATGIN